MDYIKKTPMKYDWKLKTITKTEKITGVELEYKVQCVCVCVYFVYKLLWVCVHNHCYWHSRLWFFLAFSLIQSIVVIVVCVWSEPLNVVTTNTVDLSRHFCHVTYLSAHYFNTMFDIEKLHVCRDVWFSVDLKMKDSCRRPFCPSVWSQSPRLLKH